MRILLMTISLFLLSLATAHSQDFGNEEPTEDIKLLKIKGTAIGGYTFVHGFKTVKRNTVKQLVLAYPESYNHFKASRANHTVAMILSGIAGFGIGYSIGNSFHSNEPEVWIPAIVGAGVIGIVIPLEIRSKKQAERCVSTYNEIRGSAISED